MVDPEEIAASQRGGARGHLLVRHAARRSGSHQGADAGPGVDLWRDPALLDGSKDADMRKAFKAAAAQYKGDAAAKCSCSVAVLRTSCVHDLPATRDLESTELYHGFVHFSNGVPVPRTHVDVALARRREQRAGNAPKADGAAAFSAAAPSG
jgi:hypothetical protein